MRLQTKYFGELDCPDHERLHFQRGLFGFEEERDFYLLPFEGSGGSLLCIQSASTPALAFVAMNPFPVKPDYAPVLAEAELRELAQEIAGSLSAVDAASGRELLSDFVSELFFCVTEQQRREDRRQKQAQGIAAAKARGVRFGRTARPVPDNFDQLHQAWREGRISLKQAAESCCMARGTFYNAALRRERQAESPAV